MQIVEQVDAARVAHDGSPCWQARSPKALRMWLLPVPALPVMTRSSRLRTKSRRAELEHERFVERRAGSPSRRLRASCARGVRSLRRAAAMRCSRLCAASPPSTCSSSAVPGPLASGPRQQLVELGERVRQSEESRGVVAVARGRARRGRRRLAVLPPRRGVSGIAFGHAVSPVCAERGDGDTPLTGKRSYSARSRGSVRAWPERLLEATAWSPRRRTRRGCAGQRARREDPLDRWRVERAEGRGVAERASSSSVS